MDCGLPVIPSPPPEYAPGLSSSSLVDLCKLLASDHRPAYLRVISVIYSPPRTRIYISTLSRTDYPQLKILRSCLAGLVWFIHPGSSILDLGHRTTPIFPKQPAHPSRSRTAPSLTNRSETSHRHHGLLREALEGLSDVSNPQDKGRLPIS